MIFDGEKERRAVDEAFDYVIVGSGAAGATAARVLADTGASMAIVEEGPAVKTADFGDQLFPAMRRIFRGGLGGLMAGGRALIPIVQGSCLGGSTVVNSGIVWRMPDDVWQQWASVYGLAQALPMDRLHAHWDQIEAELYVQPTPPAVWGENNRLMDAAARALHVSAGPTRRNVRDCRGSARCLLGCPYGAKQSMLVTYLPYADARGAAIFSSARVDRVLIERGVATAVTGFFHDTAARKDIAPFTLRARKAVIIAASAIQTPLLLGRSGVRSPHLGAHFQAHPGCSLMAVFDRPVNIWFGATQGFETDEHRVVGSFKIETISLPPELVLAAMPGVGGQWVTNMAAAPNVAVWAVALRAEAQGTVRAGWLGTGVRYDLTPSDMTHLRRGLRFAAEMLFAAGAREIVINVHGLPQRLTRVDDCRLFESGPDNPSAYTMLLSHLFGTARMSLKSGDGVVGADFGVHGMRRLFVIDSSVFPTNLGVNPQHTIMGVAMHAATQIVAVLE